MTQFHWTSTFFYFVFIGVMVVAVYLAYSRKSGNTHIDMAKIHLIRNKIATEEK